MENQLYAKQPVLSLDNDAINKELNAILTSKGFSASPILFRFLKFVVEYTLAGKDNEIKEYTVGVEVLGKPANFNPLLDASVRIHALRLRKTLDQYYETARPVDKYRIEIPKGSYKPVFVHAIGNAPSQTNQKEFMKVVPFLSDEDSICILPFTNFLNNESYNFSVDGFCEFLNQKLSMFEDITVLSYHSVLKYFERGGNLESIHQQLGVKYYLTGDIELHEEFMQVTVHLHRSVTNSFILSLSFEKELGHSSFMEMIDEITSKIVSSLAGYSGLIHLRRYSASFPAKISNKVTNAVFWYYQYLSQNSIETYRNVVQQMETAIKEDPKTAISWAVLGHCYAEGLIYNYTTDTEMLGKALQCANTALSLDPNCQHAHLAMAVTQVLLKDKKRALYHIDKVNSINPNSSYFKATLSVGLAMLGEYQESFKFLEKAMKLNPLPAWWLHLPYVWVALKNRDYAKMLSYSRNISATRIVYESIFEMIALYYLGDNEGVSKLLKTYNQSHPGGIDFVSKALPMVLFDDELSGLITNALSNIKKTSGVAVASVSTVA